MKKVVYETGEHELKKEDSYSIKDGVLVVYLHSKSKQYTYPLSQVKYIEEDLKRIDPNDFNPRSNKNLY